MNSSTPRNPMISNNFPQDRSNRKEVNLKIMSESPVLSTRNLPAPSRSLSKPNPTELYNKGSQENCKCRSCQAKKLAPIQQNSRPKSKCGMNDSIEVEDFTNWKEEYLKLYQEKKEAIEILSDYFKTNSENHTENGTMKNMINWVINDANKWKNQFNRVKKFEEDIEANSKIATQAMDMLKIEQEKAKKNDERLKGEIKGRKDVEERYEKLNSVVNNYLTQIAGLVSVEFQASINNIDKFKLIFEAVKNLTEKLDDASIITEESQKDINKKVKSYEEEITKIKNILKKNEQEIEQLRSELKMKNQNIELLHKEKLDHESIVVIASEKDNIIANLQNSISILQEKNELSLKTNRAITEELQEQKKKFDDYENEHLEEHVVFENAKTENKTLKSKLDLIMMSVNNLTSERDSALKQLNILQKENRTHQDHIAQLLSQNDKLQHESKIQAAKKDTENYLSLELSKYQNLLEKKEELLYEKTNQIENLTTSIDSLKSDIKIYQHLNETLQEELTRMHEGEDEDTFENVMRNELSMMRETYEKKLKELRDVYEAHKRKSYLDVKQLKDDLKNAEHSREMSELRMRSFMNKL
ncbi:unnamed protein product [Blepharisma stoltei]|uniref:Uncharacterized protein n=1 Tax=Blepharisma stoltei TaxID=1481888 RepID=A0AAU9KB28_9CILI|nr:unnamed protein product [Blepharisma stoltei]